MTEKLMDRVKLHFDSKETKVIEVPEWGEDGNPLLVFVTPMTLGQKSRLYKKAQDNDLSLYIDTLIMKAKDGEGKPLFTLADKQDLLRKADPDVISRIATEILASDDSEQVTKNLPKTLNC